MAATPTTADVTTGSARHTGTTTDVLREVSQRVLWLSAAIVDAANRGRPNASGVKVGGHQASSASMVEISCGSTRSAGKTGSRSSPTPHPCCTPSTTCSGTSTRTT